MQAGRYCVIVYPPASQVPGALWKPSPLPEPAFVVCSNSSIVVVCAFRQCR